jgi:hypothetical protein
MLIQEMHKTIPFFSACAVNGVLRVSSCLQRFKSTIRSRNQSFQLLHIVSASNGKLATQSLTSLLNSESIVAPSAAPTAECCQQDEKMSRSRDLRISAEPSMIYSSKLKHSTQLSDDKRLVYIPQTNTTQRYQQLGEILERTSHTSIRLQRMW